MQRRIFRWTFKQNFFHEKILGLNVSVEFPIKREFNLAASQDIIILIRACVSDSMLTAASEKTAYLFDIPVHDVSPPNIFIGIVVLFLSRVSMLLVKCTGCNTIMLGCDIGNDCSFLRELAENSTSTRKRLTIIHTVANARRVLHNSRPACHH